MNFLRKIFSHLKKTFSFVAQWSDILIFIPIALLVFIFNGHLIRALDPTASIVNVEFLSILNFNILVYGCVATPAYFIYNLFFHDFFTKGWEEKVGPTQAGITHVVLWVTTLILSYFVITHNL